MDAKNVTVTLPPGVEAIDVPEAGGGFYKIRREGRSSLVTVPGHVAEAAKAFGCEVLPERPAPGELDDLDRRAVIERDRLASLDARLVIARVSVQDAQRDVDDAIESAAAGAKGFELLAAKRRELEARRLAMADLEAVRERIREQIEALTSRRATVLRAIAVFEQESAMAAARTEVAALDRQLVEAVVGCVELFRKRTEAYRSAIASNPLARPLEPGRLGAMVVAACAKGGINATRIRTAFMDLAAAEDLFPPTASYSEVFEYRGIVE